MARHDRQTQAAMDWQSHLAAAQASKCPVVTFDNVPREALLEIIREQINSARESLDK